MSRLVKGWGNYRRTVQCGLLIALSSSHVQATGSAIEYSAPVDCPEKSTFLSDLRQILGHELESIHEIAGFHVTTERVGNSYRAVVSSDRGEDHASRTIAGADCSTVAHAAALAVAMAINNDESPGAGTGTLSALTGLPSDRFTSTVRGKYQPAPSGKTRVRGNGRRVPHLLRVASVTLILRQRMA